MIIIYSLYFIGIAAFAQGLGGLINRLSQADGPSWFLQLYLIPDDQRGLQIAASIGLILIGAALFVVATKKAKKAGVSLD